MAGRTATFLLPATMALLFLLVGLVAADTQLGRADIPKGTMRRALTTSDTECSTELAACGADASCIACLEALQLQASACDLDDVLIPCEEIQGRFCCALEEEDENCEADAAFLAYVECSFEEANPQCDSAGVDFDECNDATARSSSWGVPVAASVAVAGILVAALDFVV